MKFFRDEKGSIEDKFQMLRNQMVEEQIKNRGITAPEVLHAMAKIPRHLFIPQDLWGEAYEDHPVGIGEGQTISQPYIVAYMTQMLHLKKGDKVLEIGTGCGYQTAILAEITSQVYSIEYYPKLAQKARGTLLGLGYSSIHLKQGDGYQGWKEYAPYDGIIATCAPKEIPDTLVQQLAEGGRMVIPVGDQNEQQLVLVQKMDNQIFEKNLIQVIFVPMLHQEK